MKAITFYFAERQIKELKDMSNDTGISVSEQVRRAVDAHLEKYKLFKYNTTVKEKNCV